MTITWIAYAPGLHGDFLFDDFGNLPALGATGPVNNWGTFWRYITSGLADPTGRPFTLLTFLIDARDWPADPYPFKRTSLILHLINGLLLYALLIRLGSFLRIEVARARTAALVAAAIWLLHPLFVSTTLYVVQREAMLPATCILAGLLAWMHGRSVLIAGRTGPGLWWSVVGLGGFTVLGVLAKANGALLPVYALLIEVVLLSPLQPIANNQARKRYLTRFGLLAALPAAGICAYLIWVGAHGIVTGGNAGNRSWSYMQRLLTEPRVLVDYLSLLWIPRPFSSGLFNDHYTISTSLFQPITTLPALLFIAGLVIGAWWLRRRNPALALAVLFYFAGHMLESTTIPLEIYFEHRNYAPAMLMFWPLGLWLADMRSLRVFKRILIVGLPLGLALMTHASATIWGDTKTQAMMWAKINPDSPRAQANAAQVEMEQGHPWDAVHRLESLLSTQTDQTQIAFNLIAARCMSGSLTRADVAAADAAMRSSANTGTLFANWFERTLPVVVSSGCRNLTLGDLQGMIDAGLHNPNLTAAGPHQDLLYMKGRIALANHQPDKALRYFSQALDLQVRPGMALEAAADLGSKGYPAQGLGMLDHYRVVSGQEMHPDFGMAWLHEWVLRRQNYWPNEIAHLQKQLALDARAQGNGNTEPSSKQGSTH